MLVGIPAETCPGEKRVALAPDGAKALAKAGLEILVQAGAGEAAGFSDQAYEQAGAGLAASRPEVFEKADVILQVRAAGSNPEKAEEDLALYRKGQAVISMADPLGSPKFMEQAAATGVTFLAMELLPRITRAQSMDVLSSQATVAGYRAVLLAAHALPRMFPMLMTAAGTVKPARVLVVGAGVAGLMAIAQARKLGAVVEAYDIRPAVKEQVQSLGAKFVELELETEESESSGGYAKAMDEEFYRKQRELMARVVAGSDVVVTTAAVPGKKAPVLVTAEMVRAMRAGSVIVDLAAPMGGNCELTRLGEEVRDSGVLVLGPENLPSEVPTDASRLYSGNLVNLLKHLAKDGELALDAEDEIAQGLMATRDGAVVHQMVKDALSAAKE
jgi:NAD(P) transhydrogenase subunit alpha